MGSAGFVPYWDPWGHSQPTSPGSHTNFPPPVLSSTPTVSSSASLILFQTRTEATEKHLNSEAVNLDGARPKNVN